MTPKEKAKELVNKFWRHTDQDNYYHPKQCALIAVDEAKYHLLQIGDSLKVKFEIMFLNQVKEEINKL